MRRSGRRTKNPPDLSVGSVNAALDGELTVKRLLREKGRVLLKPANPDYPDFDITNREYVHIWGVVTYVIHKL